MPSLEEFTPQPQEAALNEAGQQALVELLQSQETKKRLNDRLSKAVNEITSVAGQLNDRATEERERHNKKTARLAENGEVEDERERKTFEAFEAKVAALTGKMDYGLRGVLDDRNWLTSIPDALSHVVTRTSAVIAESQVPVQRPAQKSTQQHRPPNGSVEMENEEMEIDERESRPEAPPEAPPEAADAPSALLCETLAIHQARWESKSLTQRYAGNNDYVGFYKTVFDAKNPIDPPPVPHASMWFAAEEGRDSVPSPQSQARNGRVKNGNEDDEDSDLEIAKERIRTKCPITFLTFKDPWTSTKCPHSFEKTAIFEMIKQSSRYVEWTPEQLQDLSRFARRPALREKRAREIGTPLVECPECSVLLTENDLEPNPVLLRRVKRLEAEKSRERRRADGESSDEEEEEEEGENAVLGTQRKPVGVGSSPVRKLSDRVERLKKERSARPSMASAQINRKPWTMSADEGEHEDEEPQDSNGEDDGDGMDED